MKNYTLYNTSVIEKKTNQIVWNGNLSKMVCDRLNSGAGFLGNTPTFFCQEIKQK